MAGLRPEPDVNDVPLVLCGRHDALVDSSECQSVPVDQRANRASLGGPAAADHSVPDWSRGCSAWETLPSWCFLGTIDTSHLPMLSRPGAVTDVILDPPAPSTEAAT